MKWFVLLVGVLFSFPVFAQEAPQEVMAPESVTLTDTLIDGAKTVGTAIGNGAGAAKDAVTNYTTAPVEGCTLREVFRGAIVGTVGAVVIGAASAYAMPAMTAEGLAVGTFSQQAASNSVLAGIVTVPLSVLAACGM